MLFCSAQNFKSCDYNDGESGSTHTEKGAGILIKESSIEEIDMHRETGKAQLIK
jgi:hypothetical protein